MQTVRYIALRHGHFLYPMAGHIADYCLGSANMKRCAQCHGKLGLGVRFRNLWSGRGWIHLQFCSSYCESLYNLVRHNQIACGRWHRFLTEATPEQSVRKT